MLSRPVTLPSLTFYSILGLDKNASSEEIKKAYRREALMWHPDKIDLEGAQDKADAAEIFKYLNMAQETLLDPLKRQTYDLYGAPAISKASADKLLTDWSRLGKVIYDLTGQQHLSTYHQLLIKQKDAVILEQSNQLRKINTEHEKLKRELEQLKREKMYAQSASTSAAATSSSLRSSSTNYYASPISVDKPSSSQSGLFSSQSTAKIKPEGLLEIYKVCEYENMFLAASYLVLVFDNEKSAETFMKKWSECKQTENYEFYFAKDSSLIRVPNAFSIHSYFKRDNKLTRCPERGEKILEYLAKHFDISGIPQTYKKNLGVRYESVDESKLLCKQPHYRPRNYW